MSNLSFISAISGAQFALLFNEAMLQTIYKDNLTLGNGLKWQGKQITLATGESTNPSLIGRLRLEQPSHSSIFGSTLDQLQLALSPFHAVNLRHLQTQLEQLKAKQKSVEQAERVSQNIKADVMRYAQFVVKLNTTLTANVLRLEQS